MIRDKILEKIQAEGLAIIKLHERLNELNIEHEFIDRKEKSISLESDKKMCDIIGEIVPFYYQIYVVEDGKEISLIQSPYSYGITENLIEAYNFEDEPVILHAETAAELIYEKKLNSFIKIIKEKNTDDLEKLKEINQNIITKMNKK
jgi:hypothetical protein